MKTFSTRTIRILLLFLLLLATSACKQQGEQFTTIRPYWSWQFKGMLADQLCAKEQMLYECFDVPGNVCKEFITDTAYSACYKEVASEMPFFVIQPQDGRKWGRLIGECVGGRYYDAHAEKESNTPECLAAKRKIGMIPSVEQLVQQLVTSNPDLAAVLEVSEQKEEFSADLRRAFQSLDSSEAATIETRLRIDAQRYLAKSPTEEILALLQNSIAQSRMVQEHAPELCEVHSNDYSLLDADKVRVLDEAGFKQILKQGKQVTATAVRAAHRDPQPRMSMEEIDALYEKVKTKLPAAVLQELDSGDDASCAAALAMLETITELPDDEAAALFRFILFTKIPEGHRE